MKICIKCGVGLNEENWARNQRANWINKCKQCLTIEKREYGRAWHAKNPGKSAEVSSRAKAKLRLVDPVKARARSAYSDCRKRALKSGMEFNLTPSDMLRLMRNAHTCPYFGWALTFNEGAKAKDLASIDRIDSSKGYTLDNVRVISYLANLMKSSATEDELLQFANGVMGMLGLGGLRTFEKAKGVA
jgi:hypothetical protein